MIPLDNNSGWNLEKFSNIKSNQVEFSNAGILVQVKKSASPLIYKFNTKKSVQGFKIKGEFKGLPFFEMADKQGQKGFDDYALRIGFIVPGEKKLTGIKKLFAASWVKQLYAQLPEELGLDYIQFFNFTQSREQVGTGRIHPSTDLIKEEFINYVKNQGPFQIEYNLKTPKDAVALWISIDGDDTQSDFDVLISNLEIITD